MATAINDHRMQLIEVPPTAHTLDGFRQWAYSDDFPDRGRVTFVEGKILIDVSPERVGSHVKVKEVVSRVIGTIVAETDLGEFYADGATLVYEEADLSNEPDAMMALWSTLEVGRLAPPAGRQDGSHIELVGTPDWICEVVSDLSVEKDVVTLQRKYHEGGIPEYWLIDARSGGEDIDFNLLVWKPGGYQAADEQEGWRRSPVFGKWFKLTRGTNRLGGAKYDLQVKD